MDVKKTAAKPLHIVISLVLLAAFAFMPPLAGLSAAGQKVIGLMLFAVYVWVTEAVSYPLSAIAILFFLIIFLGFSPANGISGPLLGTTKAIPLAFSGFINPGWVLVAGGICMAEGVRFSGLDKRIALNILKIVGTEPKRIIAGIIIVGYVLAFIIPSIAARAATIIPISFGLITALKIDLKSTFARYLMLTTGLVSPIAGLMLLSAGAPNPLVVTFLDKVTHHHISWNEWFVYAGPFSIILGILLYLLVVKMNKFETAYVEKGKELIAQSLTELGPLTPREKRTAAILAIAILLWATESLHGIDANTTSVLAVMLMFAPFVGIGGWKDFGTKMDWGTLLLFGAGISMSEILIKTGAAVWMAKNSLGYLGLGSLSPIAILIVLAVPLLIIRLAFASIVAIVAAVVPTMLGFLTGLNNPAMPVWGMTLVISFLVYFSFLLPVNTPSAMMAYATDTYELKDMLRIGIPLTILGLGVFILFLYTYWRVLGLL